MMSMQKTSSAASTAGTSGSVVTLRGIDPELRAALDAEAARRGLSLNGTILELLRTVVGVNAELPVRHDLDALAGAWSREDRDAFAAAIKDFERIDPSLWEDGPGSQ